MIIYRHERSKLFFNINISQVSSSIAKTTFSKYFICQKTGKKYFETVWDCSEFIGLGQVYRCSSNGAILYNFCCTKTLKGIYLEN